MQDRKCPHLYNLDINITTEQLVHKFRVGHCDVCLSEEELDNKASFICLHQGCLAALCGEDGDRHYQTHYRDSIHCLVMQFSDCRSFCLLCQLEVTEKVQAQLKLDVYETDEMSVDGDADNTHATLELEEDVITRNMEEQMLFYDALDEDDTDVKGTVGFCNLGLTCYMNAALQVLSNSPGLAAYFLQCGADFPDINKDPALAPAFQALLNKVWNNSLNSYASPLHLYQIFKQMHPSFRAFTQQDSQEFLRYFLDSLHEELRQPLPVKQNAEEDDSSCSESEAETCEEEIKAESPKDLDAGDSESAKYETCDSGVSDDEKISSDSISSTRRKSKRKLLDQRLSPERGSENSYSLQPPNCSPATTSSPPSPISSKDDRFQSRSNSSGYGSKQDFSSYTAPAGSTNGSTGKSRKKQNKRLSPKKISAKKGAQQQQYSNSIVSDMFDGQLISSVQCLTCNNVSSRKETFQDLSLPIPTTELENPPTPTTQVNNEGWIAWMWSWVVSLIWGPAVSLHQCLAAFFSADELKGDNMYSCEKCGKLRNGLKYSKLIKLPEVLVIHLKRFRHDYTFSSKISQHVTFPLTELNLQPFLHRDCVSRTSEYSLYGVILHHGSVGGGHYTALAQNPSNGNWYEFDDQKVYHVSSDFVQKCQAYVLFYKKTNPDSDVVRRRTSDLMQVSAHKESLMKFYVSKQWFNKFLHFGECGPVDNSDFLCPHGGVQPRKKHLIKDLVVVVKESVWEYMKDHYGGDAPCTRLYECAQCTSELNALLHRQNVERVTFKMLSSKPIRVYGVSSSWFKLWESFVLERTVVPPPAIDNGPAMRQFLIRKSYPNMFPYNKTPEYVTINYETWRFLQSVYGGGPEFCLQPEYAESTRGSEYVEPTRGTEYAESARGTEYVESARGTEYVESARGTEYVESTRGTEYVESARGPQYVESTQGGIQEKKMGREEVEEQDSFDTNEPKEDSAPEDDNTQDTLMEENLNTENISEPKDSESEQKEDRMLIDSSNQTEALNSECVSPDSRSPDSINITIESVPDEKPEGVTEEQSTALSSESLMEVEVNSTQNDSADKPLLEPITLVNESKTANTKKSGNKRKNRSNRKKHR